MTSVLYASSLCFSSRFADVCFPQHCFCCLAVISILSCTPSLPSHTHSSVFVSIYGLLVSFGFVFCLAQFRLHLHSTFSAHPQPAPRVRSPWLNVFQLQYFLRLVNGLPYSFGNTHSPPPM
ncbi:hypothetical protein B0J13DRAFT_559872 [Dactylonectria estremocensis]|uniref:Uncharacterized protein n=1 Tax=Dactylonectria estremocensis TaxID=1079267 RepID=A0A9P9IV55_9HYPO|nr:hypothetical protein B0J13DRAFT_559872 [Dactylonectria estremocensis]